MALKKKEKAVEETPVAEVEVAQEEEIQELSREDEDKLDEVEYEELKKTHAITREVSLRKMRKAVEVATETFNLEMGGYVLTSFKDLNSKCTLVLANQDFVINILIKDTEKHEID